MADSTIGVSKVTADDLAKIAKKNKVSRDMAISKMMSFFQIYGIDPFNYEAPHEEMTKILKRFDQIFAFLKKQEKDILIPTLSRLATQEDVAQTTTVLQKFLEVFRDGFSKLQHENEQLKEQLNSYRDAEKDEHQKVADITVSQVSKMLQHLVDHQGKVGLKDKPDLMEKLKGYEH